MQSIQNQLTSYLEKGRRFSKWQKAVTFLACIVVFCTVYALILPAITLEGNTTCGKKEHTHTNACYEAAVIEKKETLICTQDEVEPHVHTDSCYEIREVEIQVEETIEVPIEATNPQDVDMDLPPTRTETVVRTEVQEEKVLICGSEETKGHLHDEGCYTETEVYGEETLSCGMEEHSHTKSCYANNDADVESEEDWMGTFTDVTITNDWVEDTLAIAKTQLGYHESYDNYIVAEDGEQKGYTRYGEWYGVPYGDWCAMFISFCLHYADVENFPLEAACQSWISKIKELEENSRDKDGVIQYNAWRRADNGYIPKRGNLIFFDWDADGSSDHVGIVAGTENDEDGNTIVTTIEGNTSDIVGYREYQIEDSTIMGYGILPKQDYFCGMTGHTHDDDCYGGTDKLICETAAHIHKQACKEKTSSTEDDTADKSTSADGIVADTNSALTEVCVTKHWTENTPEDITVEVVLYANGKQIGDAVKLNKAKEWSHKWTELNKYDTQGELIEYDIRENAVEGYHSNVMRVSSGNSKVIVWKRENALEEGQQYLVVNQDGAVKGSEDQLSWVYAHPENAALCSQDLIWTAKLSKNGKMELHNNVTGYVIKESSSAEELDVANCMIYRRTEKELPQAEYNFVLTNTKNTKGIERRENVEFVNVSVKNQWEGRPDCAYPESVKVQLMQNGQPYDVPMGLDAENDWSMTWFQLPKSDDDGNAYAYAVEPIALEYYTSMQETKTDDQGKQNVIITNSWAPEVVTIALHKVDAGNTENFLSGAEFDLYLKTEGAEGEVSVPGTESVKGIFSGTIKVGNTGIALMEPVAGETYYLVETRAPDGYSRLIDSVGFRSDKKDEQIELTLLSGEKWTEATSGAEAVLMVKNSNGYLLPKVGGCGTGFYIMIGVSLMFSALCLMYIKTKRRASEI